MRGVGKLQMWSVSATSTPDRSVKRWKTDGGSSSGRRRQMRPADSARISSGVARPSTPCLALRPYTPGTDEHCFQASAAVPGVAWYLLRNEPRSMTPDSSRSVAQPRTPAPAPACRTRSADQDRPRHDRDGHTSRSPAEWHDRSSLPRATHRPMLTGTRCTLFTCLIASFMPRPRRHRARLPLRQLPGAPSPIADAVPQPDRVGVDATSARQASCSVYTACTTAYIRDSYCG